MDWNALKDVGEVLVAGGIGYAVATHITWIKGELAKVPVLEATLKKDIAEIRGWFVHTAPAPVKPVVVPVPNTTQAPVTTLAPIDTTTTKSPNELEGEAKIKAWLAPAIDWTLVKADELTVLYKQQIATVGVTTYLSDTGIVTTVPANAIPSPNFEIQGRVWRGLSATESERAYVGYNNPDGIAAYFSVDYLGNVKAR